jgi:hypothetical protein
VAKHTKKKQQQKTKKQCIILLPVHIFWMRQVPCPGEEVAGEKVDDTFRAQQLGAEDVSLNTVIVVKVQRQQLPLY